MEFMNDIALAAVAVVAFFLLCGLVEAARYLLAGDSVADPRIDYYAEQSRLEFEFRESMRRIGISWRDVEDMVDRIEEKRHHQVKLAIAATLGDRDRAYRNLLYYLPGFYGDAVQETLVEKFGVRL